MLKKQRKQRKMSTTKTPGNSVKVDCVSMYTSISNAVTRDSAIMGSDEFEKCLRILRIKFLDPASEINEFVGEGAIEDVEAYEKIRKGLLSAGLKNIKEMLKMTKNNTKYYNHYLTSFLFVAKGYVKERM